MGRIGPVAHGCVSTTRGTDAIVRHPIVRIELLASEAADTAAARRPLRTDSWRLRLSVAFEHRYTYTVRATSKCGECECSLQNSKRT